MRKITFQWWFSLHKYSIDIKWLRFHWKKNLPYKIDVLFTLSLGYGLVMNSLRVGKAIFFWVDALKFNVKEAEYKAAVGFSLPIGRRII